MSLKRILNRGAETSPNLAIYEIHFPISQIKKCNSHKSLGAPTCGHVGILIKFIEFVS